MQMDSSVSISMALKPCTESPHVSEFMQRIVRQLDWFKEQVLDGDWVTADEFGRCFDDMFGTSLGERQRQEDSPNKLLE